MPLTSQPRPPVSPAYTHTARQRGRGYSSSGWVRRPPHGSRPTRASPLVILTLTVLVLGPFSARRSCPSTPHCRTPLWRKSRPGPFLHQGGSPSSRTPGGPHHLLLGGHGRASLVQRRYRQDRRPARQPILAPVPPRRCAAGFRPLQTLPAQCAGPPRPGHTAATAGSAAEYC
jgi:hypothetical protein